MSGFFNEQKASPQNQLNPKANFKWVLKDIIPPTAPKCLTIETNFSDYILIGDTYSKIPKLYGTVKKSTEEVMYKLDMFQSIF